MLSKDSNSEKKPLSNLQLNDNFVAFVFTLNAILKNCNEDKEEMHVRIIYSFLLHVTKT